MITPEEAERSLRASVKSAGYLLKNVGASSVLELATNHWLSTDVVGLRTERGDSVVAYFELLNRGRATLFEFGVNRIMTPAPTSEDYEPWLPALKLRFSVALKPTLEVFQLRPVVCTFTCWEKAGVEEFLQRVRSSPAFMLVAPYQQHSSGIALEECSTPWGDPEHASRGLSWAYP